MPEKPSSLPTWIRLRREEPPLPGPIAFYIPDRRLVEPLEALREAIGRLLDGRFAPAFESLDANLHAAIDVATTPGAICVAALQPESLSGIDPLDLLRDLRKGSPETAWRDAAKFEVATDRLFAYKNLLDASQRPDIARHVNEALRQATVLLWIAFETLANDVLEIVVAERPAVLCGSGRASKAFRGAYRLSKYRWTEEESQEALRTWREEGRRLLGAGTIRDALEAAFPSSGTLATALANRHLALVAARRHVIAHQGVVIDAKYLSESKAPGEVGKLLRIEPREFDLQAGAVAISCLEILRTCAEDLRGGAAPGR